MVWVILFEGKKILDFVIIVVLYLRFIVFFNLVEDIGR